MKPQSEVYHLVSEATGITLCGRRFNITTMNEAPGRKVRICKHCHQRIKKRGQYARYAALAIVSAGGVYVGYTSAAAVAAVKSWGPMAFLLGIL